MERVSGHVLFFFQHKSRVSESVLQLTTLEEQRIQQVEKRHDCWCLSIGKQRHGLSLERMEGRKETVATSYLPSCPLYRCPEFLLGFTASLAASTHYFHFHLCVCSPQTRLSPCLRLKTTLPSSITPSFSSNTFITALSYNHDD